jgi:hypothetical protein
MPTGFHRSPRKPLIPKVLKMGLITAMMETALGAEGREFESGRPDQ